MEKAETWLVTLRSFRSLQGETDHCTAGQIEYMWENASEEMAAELNLKGRITFA